MIKSGKDEEVEAESSHGLNSPLTSWEIFSIYRVWFPNLSLILGIKSLIHYQGLIFLEIRDMKIGKSIDKYLFYVFSAFICLFITNFPYAIGWPIREFETLNRPP